VNEPPDAGMYVGVGVIAATADPSFADKEVVLDCPSESPTCVAPTGTDNDAIVGNVLTGDAIVAGAISEPAEAGSGTADFGVKRGVVPTVVAARLDCATVAGVIADVVVAALEGAGEVVVVALVGPGTLGAIAALASIAAGLSGVGDRFGESGVKDAIGLDGTGVYGRLPDAKGVAEPVALVELNNELDVLLRVGPRRGGGCCMSWLRDFNGVEDVPVARIWYSDADCLATACPVDALTTGTGATELVDT